MMVGREEGHRRILVGDTIASVIAEADELFKKLTVVPRPNGYRIRESDGSVVYEFVEAPDAC